jgi:hypothetical protein
MTRISKKLSIRVWPTGAKIGISLASQKKPNRTEHLTVGLKLKRLSNNRSNRRRHIGSKNSGSKKSGSRSKRRIIPRGVIDQPKVQHAVQQWTLMRRQMKQYVGLMRKEGPQ